MSEITAPAKFPCPACGAEAQWNPAKQALVCPFCGTFSRCRSGRRRGDQASTIWRQRCGPIPDDQRGWQAEKKSVKCQSCQAITVFDPTRVAQRCDFCGSSALIPFEEIKAPIRPESLLEFKLPETQVRDRVRQWYGKPLVRAERAEVARSLTDTVRGVYIPYWTFDAQVHADWTAEAGYYYYETENYTDSDGKAQSRQVQQTRWVPAAARSIISSTTNWCRLRRACDSKLLRKIEPFPTTTDLKPYDPAFLSGWVVEQYQIDLVAAAKNSREIMDQKTRALCSAEVPGDTQRNLEVDADFFRADLQAHSRSHLGARLHLWRQDVSGGGEWLHRLDCRKSPVELDQDHARGPGRAHRADHRSHDLRALEVRSDALVGGVEERVIPSRAGGEGPPQCNLPHSRKGTRSFREPVTHAVASSACEVPRRLRGSG